MPETTRNSPRHLSFDQAVEVWLRYWDGEYQDRIAASYDVNPGRVNEVVKRRKLLGSEDAARPKREGSVH